MTHQIIRTAEELHALDPETLLTDKGCDVMSAEVWYDNADFPQDETDRLAVIATGDQVRAARKALEDT